MYSIFWSQRRLSESCRPSILKWETRSICLPSICRSSILSDFGFPMIISLVLLQFINILLLCDHLINSSVFFLHDRRNTFSKVLGQGDLSDRWTCVADAADRNITRMWANAHVQRDGRPAEYRWRPLFNAANFGWWPLLECRAVTLPIRETRWT